MWCSGWFACTLQLLLIDDESLCDKDDSVLTDDTTMNVDELATSTAADSADDDTELDSTQVVNSDEEEEGSKSNEEDDDDANTYVGFIQTLSCLNILICTIIMCINDLRPVVSVFPRVRRFTKYPLSSF